MELRFQLKHQEIKRLDRNVVASGSRNYVTARFIPITDDWSGIVTAIFGDYLVVLDEDLSCHVPYEVLQNKGQFSVSAFCGDLHTATAETVLVMQSGYRDGIEPGEPEPRPLLNIKAAIRRAEARSAVRSFGLNENTNAHFLNLPFYETGGIKKGQRTQADIDIIKELLNKVKPHQIYLAGDLADPHGTHRVCTEAVLAALEQLKNESWLKECHVWLYRGAWMEWELGKVDMAVPLSPDELIKKRHAIYRHVSQKDIVPFPGDDSREFWQRAEDRTQNTARLYNELGMAEYQAIEVFVKLF